MLILSRQRDEVVRVVVPPSDHPEVIDITTCDIRGDKVRLGFTASPQVEVDRLEIALKKENQRGN